MRHNSRLARLERQAPGPAPHPDLPSAPNIVLKEEGWTDEDVKAECEGEVVNTHINIGTGKEISIRQLSEVIQKEIGFQGTIRFDTTKPDGTMRKLTDPSKLHRLGWQHTIELEEGIKLMYEHYLKG